MINKQPILILLLVIICILFNCTQSAYAGKIYFSVSEKQIADTTNPFQCSKSEAVEKIIHDAINVGAPVYNSGDHIGCYRVYDCAAYKILYLYGDNCSEVKKLLKEGIDKCSGDYSDIQKAWIMRACFDRILGEPTVAAPINNGG